MFIGIDLGTSSIKMILIDKKQNILASANANLKTKSPKDGFSEQNPKEWIDATIKCFEDLKNKKNNEFTNVISIGISGHMHGATLVDNFGEVIRPCILWNDTRSHTECNEFENFIEILEKHLIDTLKISADKFTSQLRKHNKHDTLLYTKILNKNDKIICDVKSTSGEYLNIFNLGKNIECQTKLVIDKVWYIKGKYTYKLKVKELCV